MVRDTNNAQTQRSSRRMWSGTHVATQCRSHPTPPWRLKMPHLQNSCDSSCHIMCPCDSRCHVTSARDSKYRSNDSAHVRTGTDIPWMHSPSDKLTQRSSQISAVFTMAFPAAILKNICWFPPSAPNPGLCNSRCRSDPLATREVAATKGAQGTWVKTMENKHLQRK